MKRIGLILIFSLLIGFPLLAVDIGFDDFQQSFVDFADGVAQALPYNTAVGQNWSDAFIGQFPHFGVGLTLGFTAMPYDAFASVADTLGVNFVDRLPLIETYGAPIPAYTIDARLGGFILPFDVGLKAGFLPDQAKVFVPDKMVIEYFFIGGDVRFRLLKEMGIIPELSVGAGYNYLTGGIGMIDLLGGTQQILDVGGYDLALADPDVMFRWSANVIDLKVQASKKILLFTPSVGVGFSYGMAEAGGGLETEVLLGGVKITDAQIQDIEDALGDNAPDLTAQGISVLSSTQGTAIRVFAGSSINLLIFRLDLTGMYNFTSGTFGGSINTRIQF